MAGTKNSGRRVALIENLRNELTLKSYRNNVKVLNSKKLSEEKKADLANKIVCRDISRKLEHSGDGIQINITQAQAEATETANDRLEKQLKAED